MLIPGLFEAYSQAGSDAVREVLEVRNTAITPLPPSRHVSASGTPVTLEAHVLTPPLDIIYVSCLPVCLVVPS